MICIPDHCFNQAVFQLRQFVLGASVLETVLYIRATEVLLYSEYMLEGSHLGTATTAVLYKLVFLLIIAKYVAVHSWKRSQLMNNTSSSYMKGSCWCVNSNTYAGFLFILYIDLLFPNFI